MILLKVGLRILEIFLLLTFYICNLNSSWYFMVIVNKLCLYLDVTIMRHTTFFVILNYYTVHVKTKPLLQVISFAVHNFFDVFEVMREILI